MRIAHYVFAFAFAFVSTVWWMMTVGEFIQYLEPSNQRVIVTTLIHVLRTENGRNRNK